MAMTLAITQHQGEFHVWAMLDDADFNPNPTDRGESFIVGSGATVIEALTDAQRELERAAGDVAVMLHDARLGLSLGTAISQVTS